VHTSILHRQNRTRFWRTTNIRAFDGGYTRAETRTRPIFCKGLVANVYTPISIALAPYSRDSDRGLTVDIRCASLAPWLGWKFIGDGIVCLSGQ
jgi:hypothetical protein